LCSFNQYCSGGVVGNGITGGIGMTGGTSWFRRLVSPQGVIASGAPNQVGFSATGALIGFEIVARGGGGGQGSNGGAAGAVTGISIHTSVQYIRHFFEPAHSLMGLTIG
jgi:hypothetical protein